MSSVFSLAHSFSNGHPLKMEIVQEFSSVEERCPQIWGVLHRWQEDAERLTSQSFQENKSKEVNYYRSSLIVSRSVHDILTQWVQKPLLHSERGVLFLCLDAQQQIQGCSFLKGVSDSPEKMRWEIEALVVNPLHIADSSLTNQAERISSIGSSLLKSVEFFLKTTTAPHPVRIDVNSTRGAIPFYIHFGYAPPLLSSPNHPGLLSKQL